MKNVECTVNSSRQKCLQRQAAPCGIVKIVIYLLVFLYIHSVCHIRYGRHREHMCGMSIVLLSERGNKDNSFPRVRIIPKTVSHVYNGTLRQDGWLPIFHRFIIADKRQFNIKNILISIGYAWI